MGSGNERSPTVSDFERLCRAAYEASRQYTVKYGAGMSEERCAAMVRAVTQDAREIAGEGLNEAAYRFLSDLIAEGDQKP